MDTALFDFKKANRFLPYIIFAGIGIGTANYILNDNLNWIQSCIQSLSTSFIIGYTLLIVGLNIFWFKKYFNSKGKLYMFTLIIFFLAGVLATEVEHIIRSLVFQSQSFQPFTAGKMYLFNGIISLVLGFNYLQNNLKKNKVDKLEDQIDSVPVKQGKNILLIPIKDVVYFEAFDNYSFVYNVIGEKKLCDYSLSFLEKRLSEKFSRVHRKYIVNKNQIKQIKPHLNGRYLIEFNNKLTTITSSKGYSSVIRKLIKIK